MGTRPTYLSGVYFSVKFSTAGQRKNIVTALLSVQQLAISTAQETLVESLSFELHAHQALTILGETGSGKSLLANAIIGNLPAGLRSQGKIALFGQYQHQRTQAEREALWGKQLAVLPQEPWHALNPIMRAGEQVAEVHRLVMGNHAASAALTDSAFQQVALHQDQSKYPHQLSGGMAQRVAYLCATQTQAPLLIADEPTKGLDASRRDQIIALLQAQLTRGALLTITHDIEVAEKLGGTIIVMRKGVIQEQGPAQQVLSHPQSDYTKALINADPRYWPTTPQSKTGEPLLTVDNIAMHRGEKCLFDSLSFTLSAGEILGISGDSGCGKSTLADLLLGLLKPSQGRIHRPQAIPVGKALKLYQDPPSALAKSVTLQTLLEDVCRQHTVERSHIPRLLERLALSPNLLSRKANQVSGGELQRFAILRALLTRPTLLVADEPTSRLDPITAASTLQLIIELTQEIGCALVLISHDKLALEKTCHRVLSL
ncbi:ABC transporter ATP-binding protein [Vibrio cholerae]|nr:ABC transporter ATP-binding protein [Vibrio cholerae]EGZ6884909.1 ABC transporter ATP-binding protein [Vibrio cholerae]TQQ19865.1 ABC transporter ATP-binding protein [Vibrio cholerae]TQQ38684.1 ABC transporter ATP-binding protein [Vibrio cholerae]TQQ58861.1 ABC transporter ATP-binding protein [Vibrio cholerae]